jgi:N4-gp56 family major capsid protein
MAENYQAVKGALLERFAARSYTENVLTGRFDWTSAKTVSVVTPKLAALVPYNEAGGAARYGTPANLGNDYQDLTLTQDKAFTYTISSNDENGIDRDAGASLARNVDFVIAPAIDTYRFAEMVENAPEDNISSEAVDDTDAYETLLGSCEKLDEAGVPQAGRVVFVSPSFHKYLKLDDSFIKASDMGQAMLVTGQVGEVDGMAVIKVPSAVLGEGVDYIVCHTETVAAPVKLAEYKIHANPQGISGTLIEGRVIFDAFVLDALADGIAANVVEAVS